VHAETSPASDQTMIVTRGEDVTAVPCGNAGVDGALKVHFQTDRPIYRPGQTVSYKAILRRNDMSWWDCDETDRWYSSNDGNLYPHDTYSSSPFVAEDTVYTDESGKVTIPFKTAKDAGDSTYTISCTVKDASRREVESSSSVPVYAAAIRLALRTDVFVTPLGSNIPLRLNVVDIDNKPAPSKVVITVKESVWDEKKDIYSYKELTHTSVTVPSTGSATAKVPAKAEGDLIIIAKAFDSTGRATTDQVSVWVAVPNAKVYKDKAAEPSIDVRMDRKVHQPGVKANRTGRFLSRSREVISSNTRSSPNPVRAFSGISRPALK